MCLVSPQASIYLPTARERGWPHQVPFPLGQPPQSIAQASVFVLGGHSADGLHLQQDLRQQRRTHHHQTKVATLFTGLRPIGAAPDLDPLERGDGGLGDGARAAGGGELEGEEAEVVPDRGSPGLLVRAAAGGVHHARRGPSSAAPARRAAGPGARGMGGGGGNGGRRWWQPFSRWWCPVQSPLASRPFPGCGGYSTALHRAYKQWLQIASVSSVDK